MNSIIGYGYGARGGSSEAEGDVNRAFRFTPRAVAVGNYLIHRVIGLDPIPPIGAMRDHLLSEITASDLVHLHVIHSHSVPFGWLLHLLIKLKKPVVWTAHDQWLLTGRCALPEGCERWRTGCGACPTGANYPPMILDYSDIYRRRKFRLMQRLGSRLTIVAPSNFLAVLHGIAHPLLSVQTVHNALDVEFESLLEKMPDRQPTHGKPRLLIVAANLAEASKTNVEFIRALVGRTGATLETVGANSPFQGLHVTNHGVVKSRSRLLALYRLVDCLVFTSVVDSFGLVVAEALAAGTPVIAVDSPGAREVLGLLGGRVVAGVQEAADIIATRDFGRLNGQSGSEGLSLAARRVFSGERMRREYETIYLNLLNMAS